MYLRNKGFKKDILVMIHDNHNKISIIKLKDTKYQIIQDLYHNFAFSRLGKPSNRTLLTCAKKILIGMNLFFIKKQKIHMKKICQ